MRLRPVRDADRPFLRAVYASTRADELAALPWSDAEREAFVAQQFEAQDAAYRAYPDATFGVVEVEGEPAGRLYVARWAGEIRIMDIALLPRFRGRGIGTALLRSLMEEADAAGLPLTIHVEAGNPARSLYARLGFVSADEQRFATHVLVTRPPAPGQLKTAP